MPNRILRDWTTSETIDKLTQGAEVFFTRLIMRADDFGNYTANTKLLKAALFPLKNYSEDQINNWLGECVHIGIVIIYTVENKEFINIPNFGQRLRSMKHAFPRPADKSLTSGGQVADKWRPETKGNEVETEKNEIEKTFDLDSNPKGLCIVIKESGLIAVRIHQQSFEKYMMGTFAQYWEQQKMTIQKPPPIAEFFKIKNGDIFNSPSHVWTSFKKLWVNPAPFSKEQKNRYKT